MWNRQNCCHKGASSWLWWKRRVRWLLSKMCVKSDGKELMKEVKQRGLMQEKLQSCTHLYLHNSIQTHGDEKTKYVHRSKHGNACAPLRLQSTGYCPIVVQRIIRLFSCIQRMIKFRHLKGQGKGLFRECPGSRRHDRKFSWANNLYLCAAKSNESRKTSIQSPSKNSGPTCDWIEKCLLRYFVSSFDSPMLKDRQPDGAASLPCLHRGCD